MAIWILCISFSHISRHITDDIIRSMRNILSQPHPEDMDCKGLQYIASRPTQPPSASPLLLQLLQVLQDGWMALMCQTFSRTLKAKFTSSRDSRENSHCEMQKSINKVSGLRSSVSFDTWSHVLPLECSQVLQGFPFCGVLGWPFVTAETLSPAK